MSTIVFVHAHPDDEASQTSGTMRLAIEAGHRVVLVYATNGDHGAAAPDLAPGETVVARRRLEAECSARVIGTHRVVWLGYADSGMHGWEQNAHDGSLASADLEEAAAKVAVVLDDEDADVVTSYDWHGGYGHPDHIAVHRMVRRALDLAARRPRELQVTMNRDQMRQLMVLAKEAGAGRGEVWDVDAPMPDGSPFGTPEAELHWRVDVREVIDMKRAALSCHASQTSDVGRFLAMPEDQFAASFGDEWYIDEGQPAGITDGLPF